MALTEQQRKKYDRLKAADPEAAFAYLDAITDDDDDPKPDPPDPPAPKPDDPPGPKPDDPPAPKPDDPPAPKPDDPPAPDPTPDGPPPKSASWYERQRWGSKGGDK